MKEARQPFSWKVKNFNCNKQVIEDYDILEYIEKDIKALKKKCKNQAEFSEELNHEILHRYWLRSEYELVIELDENNRIWLNPWVGCREPENVRIDVTDDESFDWRGFINTCHLHNNREKINVYDMLKFKWDAFVTCLWTTRLKYERKHPKFFE